MSTTRAMWDNQAKTCYRIEFLTGWKWKDFEEIHKEVYAMLGQLDHDVDLIVVFQGRVPRGGAALRALGVGGDQPTNVRHTVMVNSTSLATKMFMQSLVDIIDSLQDWEGPKFVDTLAAARAYLTNMS